MNFKLGIENKSQSDHDQKGTLISFISHCQQSPQKLVIFSENKVKANLDLRNHIFSFLNPELFDLRNMKPD